MPEENNKWAKNFDKCPGCGSTERYYEGIIKHLKDRGLLDQKIMCFDFQQQQGIGLPPEKLAILPIGSEFPAFKRIWDTCCNCGLVYSTHLERTNAKKGISVATPMPPNRAQRRHGMQGFLTAGLE